jgi:hypothetical protein
LKRWVLLCLVALAAFAPCAAAGAAPRTQPTIYLNSICTPEFPFAVEAVATGFEPNTTFGLSADSFGTKFTTDGSGSNDNIGGISASEPFSVAVEAWLDPDDDFVQDPGEPTVFSGTFVVDQPCQDIFLGEPLPNSKDECKNGGWRNFPGLRNQGECVSFVATGGKNPPAGS